ncbi:hypothetical protein CCR97_02940 [Rhodoplanes elegans]|uniref:O-antigen ligase-related domain-containing protein n=1 Tax=Rhodoplanes elegans TaxID=29408 RepID=A0A327KN71_9BRAD|nr:O-antigen ligase family protein [Rhodoplanes elegans]MBK5957164.1 hypothetical protein [Rhodoplanes elegans]RAI40340.1 hypothetical protein CH338_06475 [Rhodoplanes elegans]
MARLQSEVATGSGTSGVLEEPLSLFDRAPGKLLVVGGLFATAVAWCFIRSHYDDWGTDGLSDSAVPLPLRALVMLAMLVPALLLFGKESRLAWLAGLSASLGTVPLLPLLPFLRDYTHLVMIVWLIAVGPSMFRRVSIEGVPPFAAFLLVYVAICVVSTTANYVMFGNVWQLKVGVAYLILFGAFALLICAIAVAPGKAEMRFDNLLDGFVWGVAGQTLVALVAVPALFYVPFTIGNDTVYGIGYYDKYKSTFSGPVSLGMYFVMSVPLLLLWAHRRDALDLSARALARPRDVAGWVVLVYLQLMPWLMMATGSRTARVTFVLTLLMLLAIPRTRKGTVMMLPSTIAAYSVSFFYQSLPAAVYRFVSSDVDPSRDLSNRFFAVQDRTELAKETISTMVNAPHGLDMLGFGPGTGGYRLSGFPEPHNFLMNQWAETGVLGIIALTCFFVALIWGLLQHAPATRQWSCPAGLLLVTLLSFAPANLTYNPSYWGVSMSMVLIMSAAVVAFDQREPPPVGLK